MYQIMFFEYSLEYIFFRVSVRLGELDLNPNVTDGATPIDIPIQHVIPHELYNAQEHSNDIALLKLEKTVTFNSKLIFLIMHLCFQILSKLLNYYLNKYFF